MPPRRGRIHLPKVIVGSSTFERTARDAFDRLEQAGLELVFQPHLGTSKGAPLAAEMAEDVVGILLGAGRKLDAELMMRLPSLKAVSMLGVGYEGVDLEAAAARGIVVTNTPGVNAATVADFTFGLILTLARRIAEADRSMKRGGWEKLLGVDVHGKVLGVVGAGAIGREVVKRALGFDMQVLVYSRTMRPEWTGHPRIRHATLEELFETSDFISLHVPLTPATEGLVNARLIGRMKPTAFLINTARAGLVDRAALEDALVSRRIAGAALDVHYREPPTDDRLPTLDNVVATAHMAAFSADTLRRTAEAAVDNLLAVLAGRRPANVVNAEVYGAKGPG